MRIMRSCLIAVLLSFFCVSLSAAQNDEQPLRTLFDSTHVHVGAAVYTSHLSDPGFSATLSREFNMLTPEGEAKICAIAPGPGRFDFRAFDQLVDFAGQNDMVMRGHTLVWHGCLPRWLSDPNTTFTREQAIDLLRSYIYTVVGRYRGRVAIWDVVNEAIDDDQSHGLRDTIWKRWIGDDYVAMAFQMAHEADPDALLFYNDYGAEGMNAKSDAVYAMAQDFVQRGIPINGVGLQMHIMVGDTEPGHYVAPEALTENIERLGKLGLQVQITEMDVKFQGSASSTVLKWQADDYRRVLHVCLMSDNCTAFVTWGVSDRYSWLRDPQFFDNPDVAPLLFDDDDQPKPAYSALEDELRGST